MAMIFLGWFLDSELQNEFDENTKVNSNLNLYAKWEKSEFTIIFNTNIPEFHNSKHSINVLNRTCS